MAKKTEDADFDLKTQRPSAGEMRSFATVLLLTEN